LSSVLFAKERMLKGFINSNVNNVKRKKKQSSQKISLISSFAVIAKCSVKNKTNVSIVSKVSLQKSSALIVASTLYQKKAKCACCALRGPMQVLIWRVQVSHLKAEITQDQ
jgi:hypothetical protein